MTIDPDVKLDTLRVLALIFVARMFDDVNDVFIRLDMVELRAIRVDDVKDVARTLVEIKLLLDKLVAKTLALENAVDAIPVPSILIFIVGAAPVKKRCVPYS